MDLDRRRATLLRDGRTVMRFPVGVGAPDAPTPRGEFIIRNRLTRYRSAFYGPIALGTSARSTTLTDWPGGGYVGIHGTNEPDLIPGRGVTRLHPDAQRGHRPPRASAPGRIPADDPLSYPGGGQRRAEPERRRRVPVLAGEGDLHLARRRRTQATHDRGVFVAPPEQLRHHGDAEAGLDEPAGGAVVVGRDHDVGRETGLRARVGHQRRAGGAAREDHRSRLNAPVSTASPVVAAG